MITIVRAHVKDGVVIPDTPLNLPDGIAVQLQITSEDERPSMLELLKDIPSPHHFKTSAEADEYLQNERNSWWD